MLQRFTLAASLHEPAQPAQFGFRQPAFKLQINLHPWKLQNVRQQQLGLETGRFHPPFGEKVRTLGDDFENRHRVSAENNPARCRPST